MKRFAVFCVLLTISYHIVDLEWQNCLKVGTDKPKLKVKMQSVSDDYENFTKSHVLSWRRKMYSAWEDVTSSSRVFQVFGEQPGKHGYRQLIA